MALAIAAAQGRDDFAVGKKWLMPELKALKKELEEFAAECGAELPPAAFDTLRHVIEVAGTGTESDGSTNAQAIVPFALFRSQFEYLISDREVAARSLTDLAFEHLTRLLEVDQDARTKWTQAFEKHETACERLGAIHLLSHGIWGFKVTSTGSATDLVFGEPLDSEAVTVRRTARAVVLTEWKLIRSGDEAAKRAQEARRQTELYSAGVLGDLALKRTRYIVLVSKSRLFKARGSHRRRDYLSPYPSTFDASRSFGQGSSQRRQAKPNSNGQVSRPEVVVVEFFGERDHSPPRGQGGYAGGGLIEAPTSINKLDRLTRTRCSRV